MTPDVIIALASIGLVLCAGAAAMAVNEWRNLRRPAKRNRVV